MEEKDRISKHHKMRIDRFVLAGSKPVSSDDA